MATRPTGLGRGLGSLIPGQDKTGAVPAPAAGKGVLEVPIGKISANPDQPRVSFRSHEMEELTESIREHGILQPLTVTPKADGSYELIAGERRLRASRLAGLKAVPVIVRRTEGSREKLILALIENVQREDLNPVEEAASYERMAKEFGMTQEEIAKKVGKARSTVANTMRLLELPAEVRTAIAEGALPAGTARAILALKDDESRLAFFRKLTEGGMTARQAEERVRKAKGTSRKGKDPAIAAAEERIRESLGTRIDIRKRGGKGTIAVGFYSEEEFKALVGKLESCSRQTP